MKAAAVSKRWIGVPVLVGLLALLATVGVHAQDPMAAERFAAPVYGIAPLAMHCDTALFEEGDPFMMVDEADIPCPDIAIAEVSSVDFAGNTAWVWSEVEGETALHVYVKRDGVWERFPYSSEPDSEYLYMLEQENLSMDLVSGRPQPAPLGISAGVRGVDDSEFLYVVEQENRGLGLLDPAPLPEAATAGISADVNDPEFLYMLEQENRGLGLVSSQLQPAPGSRAAGGPSAASPSSGESGSIDRREREIDLAGGSGLNTLADLASALFDRDWAPHAAGEDHSREVK